MNLKEFLKPDWRKIIILVFFMGISLIYSYSLLPEGMQANDIPTTGRGLPLPVLTESCTFAECGSFFAPTSFIIVDIIVWYLVASLLIFAYDKFKSKK